MEDEHNILAYQLNSELGEKMKKLQMLLGLHYELWQTLVDADLGVEAHMVKHTGSAISIAIHSNAIDADFEFGHIDPNTQTSGNKEATYYLIAIACISHRSAYISTNTYDEGGNYDIAGLTKDYPGEFLFFAIEVGESTEYELESGFSKQSDDIRIHINRKAALMVVSN